MRKLLAALLVLAVLLIAADRIALAVTESLVATRMQQAGGLASKPTVRINGIPFLTQAIAGRYDSVQVNAADIQRQGVTITSLDVHLSDALVPLSAALHGQVTSVPVQALAATAVVSYLNLASEGNRAGITVKPDGNLVQVTGRVTVAGQTFTASATSALSLAGDRLQIRAKMILGVHSSTVDNLVGGLLNFSVNVPELPYGLTLTGAHVEPSGVVLTATTGPTVLTAP